MRASPSISVDTRRAVRRAHRHVMTGALLLLLPMGGCETLELELPETEVSATGVTGEATDTGLSPPDCDEYCAEYLDACRGDHNDYVDRTECLEVCETSAGWQVGERGTDFGNTIACRIRHAQYAVEQDLPGVHCPHAGPTGDGFCGSLCENYCYLQNRNCLPHQDLISSDLFGGEALECQEACQEIPNPPNADPASIRGDTLHCRVNHLIFAGRAPPASAVEHCPHGNLAPTQPCVGAARERDSRASGERHGSTR